MLRPPQCERAPRVIRSVESQLLDLGLDERDVLGLVHSVSAVVDHDDLDLVPVLNHLELLQVLGKLGATAREQKGSINRVSCRLSVPLARDENGCSRFSLP